MRKARNTSRAPAAGGPSSGGPGHGRRCRGNPEAPRSLHGRAGESRSVHPVGIRSAARQRTRSSGGDSRMALRGKKTKLQLRRACRKRNLSPEGCHRPAPHLQPLSRALQALPCFGNGFCISSCTYFPSPRGVLVPQGRGLSPCGM